MTTTGNSFTPGLDNEPPIKAVLLETLPDSRNRIWFRRDGVWLRDGDTSQHPYSHLLRAAALGSTFAVLYLPVMQ